MELPYLSLPWCLRPLLTHLHLGTPPVSPGETLFCFLKSPPPSVPLSPLLQGLGRPSVDAPPWAPRRRGPGLAGAGGGGECWCRLRALLWSFGRWTRRGTAALRLATGSAEHPSPPRQNAAYRFSFSSSSVSPLSCGRLGAKWGLCAVEDIKGGRVCQKGVKMNIWGWWCNLNSTHIFFGVTGERAPWLWTFPAPVMGDLWRALGAGGRGCWGPAVAVRCAAGAVGGTGTTPQLRVLEQ